MKTMILPDDKDTLAEIVVEKVQHIKTLEKQINALKKWIKDYTGFDMDVDADAIVKEIEEEALTPKEMEQWEQHIASLEVRSNAFNYGRKERMAESS